MRFSATVTAGGLAVALAATAPSARAGTDWTTFGFDAQRTGYNPGETVLSVANVAGLKQSWSADLGGAILTQPTVATGVATSGGPRDLVYAGTLNGALFALDRATGATVWRKQFASVSTGCEDFPNGIVGIIGTPTLDRSRHVLYLAAANGKLHALDEASGKELPGWPVTVTPNRTVDIVYTSPTLVGGSVYVETASACDQGPYRGRVVRVDAASHAVVRRWFVNGPTGPYGGGIWAPGGISASPDGTALYAATGNALTSPESYGYSEHVVRLTPALAPVASNYPGLTGTDVDFGATPVLYQAPGCPAQLAVMNKAGALFVYDRGAIAGGYRQRLQMANTHFIGSPAYDPAHKLLLVSVPTSSSDATQPYRRGLVALAPQADCTLGLAWQHPVGRPSGPAGNPSIPPVVANGVVYYVQPLFSTVGAFDETSGKQLWSSGSQIGGGIYASPTVANGQLLAAGFDGKVHAFAP